MQTLPILQWNTDARRAEISAVPAVSRAWETAEAHGKVTNKQIHLPEISLHSTLTTLDVLWKITQKQEPCYFSTVALYDGLAIGKQNF